MHYIYIVFFIMNYQEKSGRVKSDEINVIIFMFRVRVSKLITICEVKSYVQTHHLQRLPPGGGSVSWWE